MYKTFSFLSILMVFLSFSCSDDMSFDEESEPQQIIESTESNNNVDNEVYLSSFASALSKVISANQNVREFLKNESLKQFDKNYDVLYYVVSDEMIGDSTFRDLLIAASSKKDIEEIEANIPLLNIYNVNFEPTNVFADEMDVKDADIPVAVALQDSVSFFINGVKEFSFAKNQVPSFNLFVVGENTRVVEPSHLKSTSLNKTIIFKDEVFNGIDEVEGGNKSIAVKIDLVGTKAKEAYTYFYKDDGSDNQKALQRDYIYYGLTPQNRSGKLNHSVNEYITVIKVDARMYKICEEYDPHLKYVDEKGVGVKKEIESFNKKLEGQDLIDKFWTRGTLDIRVDILRSSNNQAVTKYICATPQDLWDFNIKESYRHGTWFRRPMYYYEIDPMAFSTKEYILPADKRIDLGNWDISKESLYRKLRFYEEDSGNNITKADKMEQQKNASIGVIGDYKDGLGTGTVDGKISIDIKKGQTETKNVSYSYNDESDFLGDVELYYYTPILDYVNTSKMKPKKAYSLHEYTTGKINFCISVY